MVHEAQSVHPDTQTSYQHADERGARVQVFSTHCEETKQAQTCVREGLRKEHLFNKPGHESDLFCRQFRRST